MKRRTFMKVSGIAATTGLIFQLANSQNEGNTTGNHTGKIMTVLGPIEPSEMGTALIHEHVLVDFVGPLQVGPHRYDEDAAFDKILPYLKELKALGCDTLVECTPKYIGRDVRLQKRLSEASNMHIISNTGIYAAGNFKCVPEYAYEESAEQLAARWINEWEYGIESSTIKPGFIKTGVNSGELTDIEIKLLQAASHTHLKTGLPIASHSGKGVIEEELATVENAGVSPDAFIWVHAQNEGDIDKFEWAAKKGAWISLDSINENRLDWYLQTVAELKNKDCLNRILLSHDAGWYRPGEPDGGDFRGYTLIFEKFIPMLQEAGFTQDDIQQLMVTNPMHAFTLAVKPL